MSVQDYLSARQKRFDCLPSITPRQKSSRGSGLPPVSSSSSRYNRNLYSYEQRSLRPTSAEYLERSGTPFSSDFFTESESGTPDFLSEESDSSSGSALQRSNAEATRALAKEWECIERTLYDEEGEKCTRPHIVEECKQWRALHPQLRIVGRGLQIPKNNSGYRTRNDDSLYNDLVAMYYSEEEPMESEEERVSQSSTDVTPQNSPRLSVCYLDNLKTSPEKANSPQQRPSRKKLLFPDPQQDITDNFCSLLHISPVQIRSPSHRKRQNQSILKSEVASFKWMKNSRPESSRNCDRNSAKSTLSLDTRNIGNLALSASEPNKTLSSRLLTARHRDIARLQPLYTTDNPPHEMSRTINRLSSHCYNSRKVSLPPLMLEEEKKKVHSAKKHNVSKKLQTLYVTERTRHSK